MCLVWFVCVSGVCVRLVCCRVVLFRNEDDVQNSGITLNGKPVDWSSPEGRALIRLLIPSAAMINFRIAHEVAHLKKWDAWWDVPLTPLFLVIGYHLAVFVCKCKYISVMSEDESLLPGVGVGMRSHASSGQSRIGEEAYFHYIPSLYDLVLLQVVVPSGR